jgi:hypothetical protein
MLVLYQMNDWQRLSLCSAKPFSSYAEAFEFDEILILAFIS